MGFRLLVCAAVLWGCAAANQQPPATTEPLVYAPTAAHPAVDPVAADGSLWSDESPMADLFATRKARRIGDILTVNIVESAQASNRADTQTERQSDLTGKIDNFFNLEKWYPSNYSPSNFPYINPFTGVKAEMDNTFEGSGATRRSGNIMATITVRVVEVVPNGNLRIAGSREMTINNERQFITLTGLVRPEDISWNNTVLSTYVSDARIAYNGAGIVSDRQRPGWAMRIFDVIWPF